MAPLIYRRAAARIISLLAVLDNRAAPNAQALNPFTTPSLLSTRDTASDVPDSYNSSSTPGVGTIVGIVLASVVGFLLLLWAVYSCGRGMPTLVTIKSSVSSRAGTSVVSSRHHSRAPRRNRSKRKETIDIHTTRRSSSRARPVIVESPPRTPVMAERRYSRTHGRPIIIPASVVSETTTTVTASTSESGTTVSDDIVVDHSTPPRHHSRSGIDPTRFTRGGAPIREVRRSYGRSGGR